MSSVMLNFMLVTPGLSKDIQRKGKKVKVVV